MRVLILANGDPPTAALARSVAARCDLVMATDGAAHRASALGLAPALICGDFDSIDLEVARVAFPDAEFIETPDQELADLEKTLLLAIDRGADKITILGAGGGRVDHGLAAMALLTRYHREAALAIEHDGSCVRAVSGSADDPGRVTLAAQRGDTVSLITFAPAEHITITGVAWPLEDASLSVGTHGVSNEAVADRVTVETRGGSLLVCHLYAAIPR